jgi:hypothetical protein
MKLIFFSDLHGSEHYTKKAMNIYENEQGDVMILLGDLLYHGPRNPLPEGYNPKGVIQLLNEQKDKIIAVRGNCDSEVDQMVLEFPMLSDYAIILQEKTKIFITHGHLWNEDNLPPLKAKDVLIHGHTHIPVTKKENDKFILNPGSMSLPKNDYPPTYGVIENGSFHVKTIEGKIIKEIKF